MLIKGSDIKEDVRRWHLLKLGEKFVLIEMETECEPPLRQFRLRTHEGGLNAGVIYSDDLEPGVLERLG